MWRSVEFLVDSKAYIRIIQKFLEYSVDSKQK